MTVLVTAQAATLTDDGPEADAVRDRLAWLLTAIEQRTGAAVSALAGERDDREPRSTRVVGDARVPVAG